MHKHLCPYCGRDLDGYEFEIGLCDSDDCPRHDKPQVSTITAKEIIERSKFAADTAFGQPALHKAYEWGERDGHDYLVGDKNTVDGQALMRRMKNSAYKNGFHDAMRQHGGGY